MKSFRPGVFALLFAAVSSAGAQTLFNADYENGSDSSGYPTTGPNRMEVPGPGSTLAQAEDAAYVVAGGAHGSAYAIANKVVLDDPAYVGGGFPRSEFGLTRIPEAGYQDGDHRIYTFSMLIKDLVPSVKGTRSGPSDDVLWQFKRHGAGHDMHIGLWGQKLRLGWDGNEQKAVIVDDIMPYVNQWIDFRFDVLWKSDRTGYFTFDMKLPGEADYGHAVSRTGIQTYKTIDDNGLVWSGTGSIQYGVYRNGADAAAGDTPELIVYHDDVTVTAVPEPGVYGLLGAASLGAAAMVRRRRMTRR